MLHQTVLTGQECIFKDIIGDLMENKVEVRNKGEKRERRFK